MILNSVKVSIGGEQLPLRYSLKAIAEFEEERGVAIIAATGDGADPLAKWVMPHGVVQFKRLAQFIYCGLLATKRFKSFDEFWDSLTDEEVIGFVQIFTEIGEKQLQAAPTETEGGGDSAPNPTVPEPISG